MISSRSGWRTPTSCVDLGALAVDVHLQRRTTDQALDPLSVGHEVVEADADPVTTQRGVLHRRGLHDRDRAVVALVVQLEPRCQRVHAAGLQPLLRPRVQLAARGLLERPEQVAELAVAEGVALEVATQAGQEVLQTDPRHQLLEHRGALGVGDAVEVDLDGLQVVVVRRDRVGAGQLVLAQRPVLAGVGEAGPGLVELGGLDGSVVAGPLGEGLVEPEVVPPLHRDQVAEPHVRHLVEDHRAAELVERPVLAAAREVLVTERDGSGVLHRAHVVLRHVQLVVLVERVGEVEGFLEEVEALPGQLQQLGGVHVVDQRLAAVVPERDVAVLALVGVELGVVLTRDHRGDVRRHRLGLREPPHRPVVIELLRLGRGCVGDHPPARGRGDVEGEHALQVGLLEGRVDAAGVRHLELRVGVDAVVGRVDEAVQALAGARVGAVGLHDELVAIGEAAEPDPVVGVHLGRVQCGPVEGDLVDRGTEKVGERLGTGFGAGERDPGRRGKGQLAGGQVEVHGVGVDAEQPGAGLRLIAGQVGSGHVRHHVTASRSANNVFRTGALSGQAVGGTGAGLLLPATGMIQPTSRLGYL